MGIAAALAISSIGTFGLDPSTPVTQYIRRHWGRAEGIPDTSVFAALETRDGYLWLGTEMGPVRFDGARFVLYGHETTDAIDGSLVTTLLETRDGRLLIGSRGGLAEYREGFFRKIPSPGGPGGSILTDLFQDASGRVWISSQGKLGYLEKGAYHTLAGPDGQPLMAVGHVRQTSDGTLWLGARNAIYVWKDGHFGQTTILPQVSKTMAVGESGRVWAFPGEQVRLVAGGPPVPAGHAQTIRSGVVSAFEDREGSLWVGTVAGLYRCRDGVLSAVGLRAGTPPGIAAIAEDREGRLWVGTSGDGLYCLEDPLVRSFGKPEGLDIGYAENVLQARDGALWIGTSTKGLVHWDGHEARFMGAKEGMPTVDISAIMEDSGGALWVGTPSGLMRSEGRWRFVPVDTPTRNILTTFSITQLPGGPILAGTLAGILAFRGGQWEVLDPPRGYGYALAIEPDGSGGAWLATLGRGLMHWDGKSLKAYGPGEGFPATDVPCLCRDSKGRIWAGTTNRGLVALAGEAFRALGPAEGLPAGPVYQVMEAAGCLWLSGKAGITRLRLSELDAWLEGRTPKVYPERFGQADGMRSPECNGGYQPAGCRARDGTLWFPTTEGIVSVDPARLERLAPPRPVLLEEVLADGVPAKPVAGSVRLSPGRRRLEIRYTSPELTSPQRLRFEFRLEGFDRDWVRPGTLRVASYTNLPPGRYRFEARVSGSGGPWIGSSGSLDIVQAPEFWQTWPFFLACVALLLLLLYGLDRLRLRTMRRRFEGILEERARISREIHDSLTQSFAGVVLNLEAAERSWDAAASTGKDRVRRAKEIAREGLAEARRFVRGLRPLQLESEDLASALERLVHALAADGGPEFTFRAEGKGRTVPSGTEDQLLRIAQEGLANAAKHAGARKVCVVLTFSRSEVALAVEDDGRGFDQGTVAHRAGGGFGMRGMRERTRSMGGSFEVESSPGKGTRLRVRVPL